MPKRPSESTEILPPRKQQFSGPSTPPEGLIQVESEILTSLIASVGDLRRQISQLQNEHASLVSRLDRMQNRESAFWRFPRLPVEIRRMIWKRALLTPHIHIMSNTKISLSRINRVMQSCKEAREQGLLLQFPYYHLRPDWDWGAANSSLRAKHYINLEADCILIMDDDRFPNFVEFCCPISCEISRRSLMLHRESRCSHQPQVEIIAIHNSKWKTPIDNGLYMKDSTSILIDGNDIRVLYLIVGDMEEAVEGDFYFCEPSKSPSQMLPELRSNANLDSPETPTLGSSWRLAARQVEEQLEYWLHEYNFHCSSLYLNTLPLPAPA